MIIGVDDKGKPIGVEDAKKLFEDVPNKIKDILGIIPKVIDESKKGKHTACVKVVDIFGCDTSITVEVEI